MPVDGQSQSGQVRRHHGVQPGGTLIGPGGAVAVGVHGPDLGEGRDLGHVQHPVHVDGVSRWADAGEVVDREVAERMCARHRRQQRERQEGEHGGANEDAPHRRRSFSRAAARGASRGEKAGFKLSAAARCVRAASSRPIVASMTPAWKRSLLLCVPSRSASCHEWQGRLRPAGLVQGPCQGVGGKDGRPLGVGTPRQPQGGGGVAVIGEEASQLEVDPHAVGGIQALHGLGQCVFILGGFDLAGRFQCLAQPNHDLGQRQPCLRALVQVNGGRQVALAAATRARPASARW